jgi:cyanate permease
MAGWLTRISCFTAPDRAACAAFIKESRMRFANATSLDRKFGKASGEQKRTLLAAFLGYMLDSMDVMLYALVLGQVQREMHLSAALSGAMVSATLIAAAAGGAGFGWFADRFGRVRALIWSVLIYSVGTALCGFTQTATQLMLCRVLLGLGMGGNGPQAPPWSPKPGRRATAAKRLRWCKAHGRLATPWLRPWSRW